MHYLDTYPSLLELIRAWYDSTFHRALVNDTYNDPKAQVRSVMLASLHITDIQTLNWCIYMRIHVLYYMSLAHHAYLTPSETWVCCGTT